MRTHDVVVVGGGPVGVFLGALLAGRGLDVQVWERRTGEPTGSRAIGVHPPSLDAFAAIGADLPMLDRGVRVRTGEARRAGRTLGVLRFAHASPTHPYVLTLAQHVTEATLRERLVSALPGAWCPGLTLVSLDRGDRTPDRAIVLGGRTADGTPVRARARFVVGADGPRSAVRRLLGIRSAVRAYPDRYVMGDFRDVTADGARAVVHLERDGVVESFPLPGGVRRFVVWTGSDGADGSGTDGGGVPDPAQVAALVRTRLGIDVDPATATMTSAFGVRRRFTERLVADGVALVGDAAHEISPIGGQGMNLGWADAAALAPVLEALLGGAYAPGGGSARADGAPGSALAAWQDARQRAARRGARQAEVNMALGRPVRAATAHARDLALRAVFATPAADIMASVYAMRWA